MEDEDVLYIGMKEFAYLDQEIVNELDYRAIETPGVASCFGVGFYDSDSGAVGLIHANRNKLDQVKEAIHVFDRELDVKFDNIEFWTTEQSYNREMGMQEGSTWRITEGGKLVEELLSQKARAEVRTNFADTSVSIGVEYGEGIYLSDVETAERLDDPLGIINEDTNESDKLVVDMIHELRS
ncbi:MAG: hypothetical protein ABEK16_00855 [Candidatus Nanohalobium sp.]